MEENMLNKQQKCEERCNGPICSDELEDGDSASDGNLLTINGKQCIVSRKFLPKSSFQNKPVHILTLESFIGIDGYMAKHCFGFVDLASPYGLTVYTVLPFDITIKRRNSKGIKLQSKTGNADISSYFLGQYAASAFRPQKAIVAPIGNWIFDSWNDKTFNLLKGSLLIRLDDQDSVASSERESIDEGRETNLMDSPASSSTLFVLPRKPRQEMVPRVRWLSGSNTSDQMSVSCTSTISTCSYCSKLSEHVPLLKGLLRCTWKGGIPYFVFVTAEDKGVVYIANPWKVDTLDNKNIDHMYMFHASTNWQKRDHANNVSRFVGKMKVSSCLSFSHNGSKLVETECVLLGTSEDYQRKTQTSTSNPMRRRGLSKNMMNIFKPHHTNQKKTTKKYGEINLDLESFLQEPLVDELNNMHPGLELVAVIVRNYQNDSKKERTVGGWGLKFLEKFVDSGGHSSIDSSPCSEGVRVETEVTTSLNVLVPAGLHGGPAMEAGGASSLTERWRTGGRCDCGGWDVGCPLTVLQSKAVKEDGFQQEGSHKNCSIVDLVIEGAKQEEPSLKIKQIQQDLYAVYFQPNLSALQSFSIGVAHILTRTQSLCPDW